MENRSPAYRPGPRRIAAILLNLAIVIAEALVLGRGFDPVWYTNDSNVLLGAVCFVWLLFSLRKEMPMWLRLLKLAATVTVSVTFLTVVLVLAPTQTNGYVTMLLRGSSAWLHTICPLAAVLAFVCLEAHDLRPRHAAAALIPTAVYAAVLIPLNLIGKVSGPYFFLKVRLHPWYESVLWGLGILGAAWLISSVLITLNRLGLGCRGHGAD